MTDTREIINIKDINLTVKTVIITGKGIGIVIDTQEEGDLQVQDQMIADVEGIDHHHQTMTDIEEEGVQTLMIVIEVKKNADPVPEIIIDPIKKKRLKKNQLYRIKGLKISSRARLKVRAKLKKELCFPLPPEESIFLRSNCEK